MLARVRTGAGIREFMVKEVEGFWVPGYEMGQNRDMDAACSPPGGESGEEYYCSRDAFVCYIEDEVNPARKRAGLERLDMKTAEVCYRILNDFARQGKEAGGAPGKNADRPAVGKAPSDGLS